MPLHHVHSADHQGSVCGRVCSDRVCFTASHSFHWNSQIYWIVKHEHSSSAAASAPSIRKTGLAVLLSENGMNSSSQHGVHDQSMLLLGSSPRLCKFGVT